MNTSQGRAGRRVGGSLVGLVALAAVVVPASPAGAATSVGRFESLSADYDIQGVAILSRTSNGTSGRVVVTGLEPGVVYAAHLHNAACAASNPGGGHYQNAAGAGVTPPNELWFSSSSNPLAGIRANRGGVAIGRGSAEWVARPDARAVVIHAIPSGGTPAGGPKIACADLA